MADIVLINPKFEASYWGHEHALHLFGKKASMPVAALPLLAALTPPEHTITLMDENVEPIDYERCAKADIVGMTGMIVQRFRMMEIITELKKRDCFVALGGPWVSVKEDYFDGFADAVFVGEAENTWPRFLDDWQRGVPAKRYEQEDRTDMSRVPVPRHDLLKIKNYALGTIQFSRGCPFMCEFCDIIVTFGRKPRLKTKEQIVAELESLHKVAKVQAAFIVDDNLIGNKKAVKEILRAVIDWQAQNNYPLSFITEASLDLADDDELIELMDLANIRTVFVGIETPNEDALKETKKTQNLRGHNRSIPEKVASIQAYGIEVWSGMMLGFDTDKPDIFDRQIKLIEDAKIVHSSVGMVTAIPKTPLYDRMLKADRLDLADRTPFGTNILPVSMEREELRDGYLSVLRGLYSPEQYFKRLDSLYLDRGLGESRLRQTSAKEKPLAHAAKAAIALLQTAFIFVRLQTAVKERELRRHYRRFTYNALRRRPNPFVLQTYALRSAMHYHYHRLLAGMAVDGEGHLINIF
ncbi:MAG: DUF4070 domain-containing protein [Methylobacteriaceae bacterium]|nr:DUF4070 domain-containing protein [Methylobacteriaceae bacterium]